MDGQINLSLSYDRRSDILYNYGAAHKRKQPRQPPYHFYPTTKTRIAAIVVTNCNATHRNARLRELAKYMPVDIFSPNCGTRDMPVQCTGRYSKHCYEFLSGQYFFYLSLENADCTDYVTEKLWVNALDSGMVPVCAQELVLF